MIRPRTLKRPPQGTMRVIGGAEDARAIAKGDKIAAQIKELMKIGDKDLNRLADAVDEKDDETIRRLTPALKKKYGSRLFALVRRT